MHRRHWVEFVEVRRSSGKYQASPFTLNSLLSQNGSLSLSLSIYSSLYSSSSLSLSGLSRWLRGRMEVPKGKRKKEGRRWLLDSLGAVEEWVQLGCGLAVSELGLLGVEVCEDVAE